MKPAEYSSLRVQYEVVNEKTPNALPPGSTIIEQMDKEIEEGEFTPFRLEELPSREEVIEANKDKNDALGVPVTLTATGAMIRQQVRVKVPPPKNPEAFRMRIDILCASLEFNKLKNPTHPLIKTSEEKVWQTHVKYILGPKVMGLESKDLNNVVVKTPSWKLVLHYNQQIFDKVAELMNEGGR